MPEAVAELRVLRRYQDALIRDRTRLINRLRYLLSHYWRELLASQRLLTMTGVLTWRSSVAHRHADGSRSSWPRRDGVTNLTWDHT